MQRPQSAGGQVTTPSSVISAAKRGIVKDGSSSIVVDSSNNERRAGANKLERGGEREDATAGKKKGSPMMERNLLQHRDQIRMWGTSDILEKALQLRIRW